MKRLSGLGVALILLFIFLFANVVLASVYVKGYFRKDGTYVEPHYRSDPDGNFYNNWSTYPNVNPYTGEQGTKMYPPSDSYPSSGYGSGSSYDEADAEEDDTDVVDEPVEAPAPKKYDFGLNDKSSGSQNVTSRQATPSPSTSTSSNDTESGTGLRYVGIAGVVILLLAAYGKWG